MIMNRTGYRGLSAEKRKIKEQAVESMKKIRLHHFEEERANESKKKRNNAEKEILKFGELDKSGGGFLSEIGFSKKKKIDEIKKIHVEKKYNQQSTAPKKEVQLINNSKKRKNENSKQNNICKKILKSGELQSSGGFLTKIGFGETKAISKTQRIGMTEAKKTNINLDEYFGPGLEQSIITADNISQFVSHFSNQKKIEKYNTSNNHKKENNGYKKNDKSESNMQINNYVIKDNIVKKDIVKTPKEKNQTIESKNYLVEQKKNITEKINNRNSSGRYVLWFIISIIILLGIIVCLSNS